MFEPASSNIRLTSWNSKTPAKHQQSLRRLVKTVSIFIQLPELLFDVCDFCFCEIRKLFGRVSAMQAIVLLADEPFRGFSRRGSQVILSPFLNLQLDRRSKKLYREIRTLLARGLLHRALSASGLTLLGLCSAARGHHKRSPARI